MLLFYYLQFFLGNIHLCTIVVALGAYFSRSEPAIGLSSHAISIFSHLSILLGGLAIGRGNLYAVCGAVLGLASHYCDRPGVVLPVPAMAASNTALATAYYLFTQGNTGNTVYIVTPLLTQAWSLIGGTCPRLTQLCHIFSSSYHIVIQYLLCCFS